MSKTLDIVIADLKDRELKGLRTYGVTVDRDDYSHLDWLIEAYQETLDNALYLQKAIQTEKERLCQTYQCVQGPDAR